MPGANDSGTVFFEVFAQRLAIVGQASWTTNYWCRLRNVRTCTDWLNYDTPDTLERWLRYTFWGKKSLNDCFVCTPDLAHGQAPRRKSIDDGPSHTSLILTCYLMDCSSRTANFFQASAFRKKFSVTHFLVWLVKRSTISSLSNQTWRKNEKIV